MQEAGCGLWFGLSVIQSGEGRERPKFFFFFFLIPLQSLVFLIGPLTNVEFRQSEATATHWPHEKPGAAIKRGVGMVEAE